MKVWMAACPEEAERFERDIERLAAIAFPAGCRFAVSPPLPISEGHWNCGCTPGTAHFTPLEPIVLGWEFVILMPGEMPGDRDWIIYEDRGGVAVGRKA